MGVNCFHSLLLVDLPQQTVTLSIDCQVNTKKIRIKNPEPNWFGIFNLVLFFFKTIPFVEAFQAYLSLLCHEIKGYFQIDDL